MPPKLNRKRALFVLTKIDEILAWEKHKEQERDTRFVDLGRYLCEVRAGQYWRLQNLNSFDEFLQRRFPDSRRTAYYLMSIHEHLPPQIRRELKQVGWTKAAVLTKVARSDGKDFDCASWMHKARSLPRDQFKREVDQHITGKDTEPTEIIYFKFYKSQIPVIEQAIETAARIGREIVSFRHPRISAIKLAVADPNADLLRGDMTADEMREIIRRKLIEEGLLPPPVEH